MIAFQINHLKCGPRVGDIFDQMFDYPKVLPHVHIVIDQRKWVGHLVQLNLY